jgi:hypothetical protein
LLLAEELIALGQQCTGVSLGSPAIYRWGVVTY